MSGKYTYLVWDWNGTLLDDVTANFDTVCSMLARHKLPPTENIECYRRLFSFPISDFYTKVGFDLERESFDALAEEYVAEYTLQSKSSRLFEDVPRALRTLDEAGVKMAILSATEQTRLIREVASYGLDGFFEHILGVGDNLGKSKAQRGREFVRSLGLPCGERVLFVGDCVHDAEVARLCGADCVLVARGHMDRERLEETGFPVLDSLDGLCELILK